MSFLVLSTFIHRPLDTRYDPCSVRQPQLILIKMETLAEIATQAHACYTRALGLAREDRRLEITINTLERSIEEAERRLSYLRSHTNRNITHIHNTLGSSKVVQKSQSLRMHTPLLVANILVLGGYVIKTILGHVARKKGFF